MFHYESDWTNAAIRRFIVRVQKENFEDLFDLRLADVYGMHNKDYNKPKIWTKNSKNSEFAVL